MRPLDPTSTRPGLWFAFLAGPVAWTLHELLSYALVKLVCSSGLVVVLHVVTLGTLALAGAGVYVALRAHGVRVAPPRDASDFLAGAAVLTSGLFAFAIFMEGMPDVVVSPCL